MNVPAPTGELPQVLVRHAWVMFAPVVTVRTPATLITADDWDALFGAVVTRLTEAARAQSAHNAGPSLQAVVLECVDALQLLQEALAHERAQRHGQPGD